MRRLAAAAALAAGWLLGAAPLAPAVGAGEVRLHGTFAVSGLVTAAHEVPGEHAGEHVARTWTFAAGCPAGACSSVVLVRGRGPGRPRVSTVLDWRPRLGRYTGRGSFFAPLRCAGRTYRPGELVRFRLSVRVTATAPIGGQLLATAIRATYASTAHEDLTPCVDLAGQGDAARYRGRRVS